MAASQIRQAQCPSFFTFKQGDSRLGYEEAYPLCQESKVGEGKLNFSTIFP